MDWGGGRTDASFQYGYDHPTRRVQRAENGALTQVVFSGGTSVQKYLRGSDKGGDEWMRYCNLKTGTWLSRDPIGEIGGLNLYAYVSNSPINFTDPMGLILWQTQYWADLSVNGNWAQRQIAKVLGVAAAAIPDTGGASVAATVKGPGPGYTSGYNVQAFIPEGCPEGADYVYEGPTFGTPQAAVGAQVNIGWSDETSAKSNKDSWLGTFNSIDISIGKHQLSFFWGGPWKGVSYGRSTDTAAGLGLPGSFGGSQTNYQYRDKVYK